MRFGGAVIDIGAQSMQRKLPLQIPFAARDFRTVQPAGYTNFDPLATKPQRRIDGLAHSAPECHALFQLQGNRFRHELGIELRLVHFLDVDEYFAFGLLRERGLELLDLGALAADDDARTGSPDRDPKLVARTIDFNRTDARRLQLLAQAFLEFEIFLQEPRVSLLREPARAPRLVEAEPETVRMNFLTHYFSLHISVLWSRPWACALISCVLMPSPRLLPRCARYASESGMPAPSAPAARASGAGLH